MIEFEILIKQLMEAGWTQTMIAEAVKCSQSTISDLARGVCKRVSYEIGHRLVALWLEVVQGTTRPITTPTQQLTQPSV
jgi:predicted XRE-type DNA-binding protein